ncbi:HU family DNA-binding protein [uncultured Porphyromonas sp.]|uniref:HU family DNA-binding protein n=1 Tax=uncultured Porphyromonas sp. TaxID=159274 RepID=UPI00258D4370|nr:HU family DNA-binding protein [uncultured Porphyromonas sp.]
MAKYIMRELPKAFGRGKRLHTPRILIEGTTNLRDLAEQIARGTTFAAAEVEGMVGLLIDAMSDSIAAGYAVRIKGLGSFRAKLGYRKDVTPEIEAEEHRNAVSLRVAGITFRPEKSFLQATGEACRLSRQKRQTYASPHTGQSERLAVAQAFLREHGVLRVKEYKQLVSLSHTAASAELRSFAEEGLLVRHGARAQLVYTLPPTKD